MPGWMRVFLQGQFIQPKETKVTRIYVVTETDENEGTVPGKKLVRAGNPAQAIRHVTKGRFTAEVADQDTLVACISAGTKVEDAAAETGEG